MSSSRTFTIEVTGDDIAAGTREDCILCPVARAASRRFGRECLVDRDSLTVAPEGWEDRAMFDLPPNVIRKIARFDATGKMRPFTFEVSNGA